MVLPPSPIPSANAPSPTMGARMEEDTCRQAQNPSSCGDDEVPVPGADVPARAIEMTNPGTMGASHPRLHETCCVDHQNREFR